MMKGFSEKITKSIADGISHSETNFLKRLNVVADRNAFISTWIGASMVSSMSSFKDVFITKEEYNESGENRIALFQKIF